MINNLGTPPLENRATLVQTAKGGKTCRVASSKPWDTVNFLLRLLSSEISVPKKFLCTFFYWFANVLLLTLFLECFLSHDNAHTLILKRLAHIQNFLSS